MTTYSNLKYDHPFSSNATGTGSLTLISSQTASASANISFTTGIDSTYDEYIFKFINIHPSTNGTNFQFNLSTDSGSNYNVTKTTTIFNAYHYENDSSNNLAYIASWDLAQSTSYQSMMTFGDLSNSDDHGLSGTMQLFNPSSTTYVKHFISTVSLAGGANGTAQYENNDYMAGYGNTTSAINAIDFKMSSGNIDDGTILMYGVN
jgi:hypothetical protein